MPRRFYRFTLEVNDTYPLTKREKLEFEVYHQGGELLSPLFPKAGLPQITEPTILIDRFIWEYQLPDPTEFIAWIKTQPGVVRFGSYELIVSEDTPDLERLIVREDTPLNKEYLISQLKLREFSWDDQSLLWKFEYEGLHLYVNIPEGEEVAYYSDYGYGVEPPLVTDEVFTCPYKLMSIIDNRLGGKW